MSVDCEVYCRRRSEFFLCRSEVVVTSSSHTPFMLLRGILIQSNVLPGFVHYFNVWHRVLRCRGALLLVLRGLMSQSEDLSETQDLQAQQAGCLTGTLTFHTHTHTQTHTPFP